MEIRHSTEDEIRSDTVEGNSYVCICGDRIVGTFFFNQGKEEPAEKKQFP